MKTVVHGLPINGTHNGRPAIEALAGGSFLASYFYTRPGNNKLGGQVDRVIDLVGENETFYLDNGAFTAYNAGFSIADDNAYLEGFFAWATNVMQRCPQAVTIIPDVIDGSAEENDRMISESAAAFEIEYGIDSSRLVPVWHLHESLERLQWLAESWNHVAIGSSGDFWKVNSPEWRSRIDEMFAHLDALYANPEYAAAYTRPRLHMLRGIAVMDSYRFDSADSTNISMNYSRQRKRGEDIAAFRSRVETKANAGPLNRDTNKLGTVASINREIDRWNANRIAQATNVALDWAA